MKTLIQAGISVNTEDNAGFSRLRHSNISVYPSSISLHLLSGAGVHSQTQTFLLLVNLNLNFQGGRLSTRPPVWAPRLWLRSCWRLELTWTPGAVVVWLPYTMLWPRETIRWWKTLKDTATVPKRVGQRQQKAAKVVRTNENRLEEHFVTNDQRGLHMKSVF